jgi:hypothetical protein
LIFWSEAMTAIQALLDGLIDYAGFAPPASLPMAEAVRRYAAYRQGPHAWALGRFIVPTGQLEDLHAAARDCPPFRLSVLSPPAAAPPTSPPHFIEALEVKADSPDDIAATMRVLPKGMIANFEIPVYLKLDLIEAIAETHARAKVRTGGLTLDFFPTPADLADFIAACAQAKVPFKATAGLHHPIRGIYKLTYDASSPSCVMHGFLNVFLAAALTYHGGTENDAIRTLEEQSADAFRFDEAGVSWHGHRLSAAEIAEARKSFAISFGSCSFEEPIGDLQALGLLV